MYILIYVYNNNFKNYEFESEERRHIWYMKRLRERKEDGTNYMKIFKT